MLQKAETIYHKANELVRRCGTRDTLRIAGKIGIYIHQIDTFKELLGMYSYQHKERHILLNSNMDFNQHIPHSQNESGNERENAA